jgi:hypothetical protein
MRLRPKTRLGIWATVLALWVALGAIAWWAAPYRLVAAWPTTVGGELIDFLPGEEAILVVRHPDFTGPTPDPDPLRRLNRLDLRTGEVRELLALRENMTCSRLLAGGRWLAIYCYGDVANHVLLYEVATGRQVELPTGTGTKLAGFTESPSGQYLAYRDGSDGLRIVDLSLDRPTQIGTVPDRPGFMTIYGGGFGIDDRGRVFALTRDSSGASDLDAVSRYDGPTTGWREFCRFAPGEIVEYVVARNGGVFLACVRSRDVYRVETHDCDDGRHLGTASPDGEPVGIVKPVDTDPLREWLSNKLPGLKIAPYVERISLRSRSGTWVTVKSSAREAITDSFSSLESDDDHPYLVVADEDGVQVWNDPPRRSTRWLAGWLGSGGLLMLVAWWRRRLLLSPPSPGRESS